MLAFRTFTRTFPSTEVIRKHWPPHMQPSYAEVVKLRRLINNALFASLRSNHEQPVVIAEGSAVVWRIFRAKNGMRVRVTGRPDIEKEIAAELRRYAANGIRYRNQREIATVGDAVVLRKKNSNIVLFDPYIRCSYSHRGME